MTISVAVDDGISDEARIPLLTDIAGGFVDHRGRPASRSKYGGWKSASFTLVVPATERFCYYGISSNLMSYLTGSLGQSTAVAAANLNTWFGVSQLTPILGAFLADSFLGRYKMIIIASILYVLGNGFLSLSASLNSSAVASCRNNGNTVCSGQTQLPTVIFFISLYIVAFAQGGHYPCMQAFGADQFDDEDENESRAKSSFFNWYNCFSCGGSFIALLVLSYIQDNVGWVLGFGIPSIVMCFSLILLSLGTWTYRFRVNCDGRNPFMKIIRVFVRSARNWKASPVPGFVEVEALPQENAEFRILDRALLGPDEWKADATVCSKKDVEEAKAIVRLVPIWLSSLGYALIFSQPSTLFTKQASTMNRHLTPALEIPAASFQLCITLSVIVFIPIYDRLFVPIARAVTKKPSGISMLQRIGTGLFLNLVSIIFAAIIEKRRLTMAAESGLEDLPKATVPMSVWWLAPQYLISGIGDVFAMVGLQEFFYDQAPCELKSVGVALYLSILGAGSLASSFLVSTIESVTGRDGRDSWFSNNLNRAHLDYFYWVLAGIGACAFAAYLKFSRSYVDTRRTSP